MKSVQKYLFKSGNDVYAIQWTGNNIKEIVEFISSRVTYSAGISFRVENKKFIFGISHNNSFDVKRDKSYAIQNKSWLTYKCNSDKQEFKTYRISAFHKYFEKWNIFL